MNEYTTDSKCPCYAHHGTLKWCNCPCHDCIGTRGGLCLCGVGGCSNPEKPGHPGCAEHQWDPDRGALQKKDWGVVYQQRGPGWHETGPDCRVLDRGLPTAEQLASLAKLLGEVPDGVDAVLVPFAEGQREFTLALPVTDNEGLAGKRTQPPR